jgi:type VI protein secretion system component VasF
MNRETAALVDPIFVQTWRLRGALAGVGAGIEQVLDGQAELKQLLSLLSASDAGKRQGDFLGIHYPLVCWIDELMTGTPGISEIWNENKLEGEIFGSNDRAWMFWRQAEIAESIGRETWLEVFYLCVAHGFTGNAIDRPGSMKNWLHRTRIRIGCVPDLSLPFEKDLAPAADVPPLYGQHAVRRMLTVAWGAAAILLPALSYLTVRFLTA